MAASSVETIHGDMQQTVYPAKKLVGEVQVPGSLDSAARALSLAVLSTRESQIDNVPPSIDTLAPVWRRLGVEVERQKARLKVQSPGLKGIKPVEGILEAEVLGEEILILMALLAVQAVASRLKVEGERARCRQLAALLTTMGARAGEEIEGVFLLGGKVEITGTDLGVVEADAVVRLALLVAALGIQEKVILRETEKTKERVERPLVAAGAKILRQRNKTSGEYSVVCYGDQEIGPQQNAISGDLSLAMPLVIAALGLKGSKLRVRRVEVAAGKRAVLDLLRQIGAKVDIENNDDGSADLLVEGSEFKATRIAGTRAEKLMDQVPLVAVLATQPQGEFVLRDITALRSRSFDYIAHLVAMLRLMGAKVGEFPEGLIVKGGYPLKGAQIDTKGDVGLALAFAVAGLWAAGETGLEAVESVESVYPGFFMVLEGLKEKRGRRK
jgi:3-phosphoshikimate 1-carboxyvinyltransferase